MANKGAVSSGFTYDAFLSFRGEDTRYTFTGYLHDALCRKGINAFLDDEKLKRGEEISPSLSKAIEGSRISIIVFSENYASSTWCLGELVTILECMKEKNRLVFPIFYRVEPSDVRHQRNGYGLAMEAHEKRYGKDSEKVRKWRAALFEVSNLKGDHFTTGYEFKFIEKIVKDVSVKLPPKPLHIGEHLVGFESRVQELKSLLDIESDNDGVCMLGIYGVGGIGKTALAKALYNNIAHQFEAASFLADVREKSNKINGLEDLQKTLLSEMMEQIGAEFGSTGKGTYEIKCKLGQKKVLLVLDDVDDIEKLEQLAGGCDWFGPGSRIIITTRHKDLLNTHQVEKVYKMTELNFQDSLELFCWNAFKKKHPETSYEDVSSRAVGYANGLPLALKVIGSNLMMVTKNVEEWEFALEEYKRIPDKKIQNVLKVSYDSLGDNAKDVFLDIACFFKRERVEYVTEILDACEFGARRNIGVLVDKSLITIEYGCLKMHDLIQDMGREIVRQGARSPGERSRLWFYEDIIEVLTDNSGSSKIEGIMLDPPERQVVDWSGIAFEKMNSLRILIVRNTTFSSGPKYLPNHLKLLDWEEYPSKSFPPGFYPKKIVVFNVCKSHLTLDEPFQKFAYLTYMNFSYSQSLTEIPDLSEVQNLRELRFEKCEKLIRVHESVGLLKKLVRLSASGCMNLRTFLPRMFLPSLGFLNLNDCVRLERFPEIVGGMMYKPLEIWMWGTAIEELPHSVGNLVGLTYMQVVGDQRLDLPSSLFMLPNFLMFDVGGCVQLGESFRRIVESHSATNGRSPLARLNLIAVDLSDEDLPAILNCFPKLEELNAWENNFVSLPACIKESVCLTSLDVGDCPELQKIPEFSNLERLDVSRCEKLQDISKLPATIQRVYALYCVSLTRETSTMLWSQALKEINELAVVMPRTTEIPEWFDFRCNGGTPRFWARGKFPIVALALMFEKVDPMAETRPTRCLELLDLNLLINGQCVPGKDFASLRIAEDHVLLCDLRVLFSHKQWLGLDALLEHDWNTVQVSYKGTSPLALSCWGVYVYKQQTNMKDVQFMCPHPMYSDMTLTQGRSESELAHNTL